jgi:TPR repeat protein
VFILLVALVTTSCSNSSSAPNAGTRKAQTTSRVSLSPLAELTREANGGDAKAQHALAGKYLRGDGVRKNLATSLEWEQKSADRGYAVAQALLAQHYIFDMGGSPDFKQAASWAQKAAVQGNAQAQYELALLYFNGKGLVIDKAKAVALYQQAAAQGNVQAQVALWKLYRDGAGVTKSNPKAIEWLQKAAVQGSAYAQWRLSLCYSRANEGCPKVPAIAARWYQKALTQGSAQDQSEIGDCYAYGLEDCGKTSNKALVWYEAAAAHGEAEDQSNLATCYRYGFGCPKNLVKAAEWYEKAAVQGDVLAIDSLAMAYEYGTGVTKNAHTAVEWYSKAAAQGDALAIDALGSAYENGRGVIKDTDKAVELHQQAAAKGYSGAFGSLSRLYFMKGLVTHNRHDWVLAYVWANIGAQYGGPDAKDDASERETLEARLTQAEIEEGQRLSSVWKPGIGLFRKPVAPATAIIGQAGERPTKQATGTAFVVDKTGVAVTNEHVIHDCREMRLQGSDGIVKVLAVDAANDLALLQLPDRPATSATFSEADQLRQGDDITVFGFPLNGVLASGGNLTTGVISGLTGLHNNTAQFQITAAIQPGSSGSPVMNDHGDVIGIVSSKLSDAALAKASGSVGENVNFAIRGQELKSFLDANRVAYQTGSGSWFSRKKGSVDIADAARKWTVIVECWK